VVTGRELLALTGFASEVTHLAFSPDGLRLATGNGWHGPEGQDRARIWDVTAGRELLSLGGGGFVAFSPDGRRVATSSGNAAATIWDAITGNEFVRLIGHSDWVECGSFSPDGKRIATACGDRTASLVGRPTVKIWDTADGRELLTIERGKPDGSYISRLAFSPDGKRIAFAGGNRTPRVWDRTRRSSGDETGMTGG
jgi:WD40 repeat protein